MQDRLTIRSVLTTCVLVAAASAMTGEAIAGDLPDGVIAVDQTATGANNGTSWTDAYVYLKDALAEAQFDPTITKIWVAQATYLPDQDTANPSGTCDPGPCDRGLSFQVNNGITLYGGFAGGETAMSQRDIFGNETILSGDLLGDDGPDFANYDENSYHVVKRIMGAGTGIAVINGFTITAGNANGAFPDDRGGATRHGRETAYVNCAFKVNRADSKGGALYSASQDATVHDCRFLGNLVGKLGGAIALDGPLTATVMNTLFVANHAGKLGGGLYVEDESQTEVINSTFTENTSGGVGSAVRVNLTVPPNPPGLLRIKNCIVWNNTCLACGDPLAGQISVNIGDLAVRYSDVQLGYDGQGNIDADPRFVDPDGPDDDPETLEDNNYRLLACSPCIGAGYNPYLVADTFDVDDDTDTLERTPGLDFNDRILPTDGTVDMGPYELVPDRCPWDLDGDGDVGPADLAILLTNWGTDPGGPPDFNCDGTVDSADLAALLTNWGPCPESGGGDGAQGGDGGSDEDAGWPELEQLLQWLIEAGQDDLAALLQEIWEDMDTP